MSSFKQFDYQYTYWYLVGASYIVIDELTDDQIDTIIKEHYPELLVDDRHKKLNEIKTIILQSSVRNSEESYLILRQPANIKVYYAKGIVLKTPVEITENDIDDKNEEDLLYYE